MELPLTKLVIFDLDGVLVDAVNLHKVALEEAMQEILGFKISDEEHKTVFNGLPTKKKLRLLGIKEELVTKVNDRKQEITMDLISKLIKPDQTKIDMMNELSSRGIKIACVTNSIRKTAKEMLKSVGVLDSIGILVSNEDVVAAKPDPEGYLKVMTTLGIKPHQTIIVEDSDHGFKAALESRASVLRVRSPEEVTIKLFEAIL